MRRASSVLLPSLGPSWHPSDGPGLTAFPTGVMDASERDQTVPKLTGWEPWGALGRGIPLSWCPTLGWAVQQHWLWVLLGVWSTVLSGFTGICGPSRVPQHPMGQGQAVPGPSWRSPTHPPGAQGCTCCLASARRNTSAGKEKCLGTFWGFPSESWDLGIFCPPPCPLLPHSHTAPGVTNGFKKSNSPHNALPLCSGCC